MRVCMRACVCVCVAKPVAVELRCHATALILVIGKAQFRRAMLSCDSSCYYMLGGNLGSLLYGDVSVMQNTATYNGCKK